MVCARSDHVLIISESILKAELCIIITELLADLSGLKVKGSSVEDLNSLQRVEDSECSQAG
jgi:hypothetical protein